MYQKCHLIHADLSEYNLLWHRGRVVFIDVGQSVEPSHPNGLEFLLRDCTNISSFFDRVGVHDVKTSHQLFDYVSGLQISATSDAEFTAKVSVIHYNAYYQLEYHLGEQLWPDSFHLYPQTTCKTTVSGVQ